MLHPMNLLLAAEEAAEEAGGIKLILPETAELVWGAICFAVVLLVLTKVAFPKLRETIEKREQTIQADLEAAENAKAEANKQLSEYKQQLAEARSDANRIIEEARQSAEQVRKDLTAKAEQEAAALVQRAQEQISAERKRTMQELQGSVVELSVQLAEKIVGRTIDQKSQSDLVDAYIKEVGAMNGGGR